MINSKLAALIFSIIMILAVVWPVRQNWQENPKDDFPLSYYPMFSHQRKSTHSLPYFVGYDVSGRRYCIPYKYLGTGGFNQVRRQINKHARQGDVEKLTGKVARRLARCQEAPFNKLVRVEMVRGRFRLDDYFLTDNKRPVKETVYSHQNIKRR
ncbi:hypothetical protein QQ020_04785 [Fulvivirgaceae bacterium BMA12]|uniref:Uncharacterized protein n=1 Tax=Agaribacillus aureus TaxID=3051825 RepID=A0ABT8L0X0_9BACT|nr:hypothetical protein [Fulvivirgaceae bacterium BMA12]